ncbi:hypothetical protein SRHO_G00199100 [Serrasalmus rhombeus]
MGLSWCKTSSLCSQAGPFADRCCDICCQLCLEGCCGACADDCRYTFWFMCTRLANYCLAFTSSEEPQRAHHTEVKTTRRQLHLNSRHRKRSICLFVAYLEHILKGEKEDSPEPCEAGAGTLAMEEDYMKQGYPDVVRQQHTSNVAASQSADKKRSDSGPNCCMQCCMKTKNCLMSPECGRALSIASVISMCGMCIRMWTCQSRQHEQQTMAPLKVNEMLPQSTVKKLNV